MRDERESRSGRPTRLGAELSIMYLRNKLSLSRIVHYLLIPAFSLFQKAQFTPSTIQLGKRLKQKEHHTI